MKSYLEKDKKYLEEKTLGCGARLVGTAWQGQDIKVGEREDQRETNQSRKRRRRTGRKTKNLERRNRNNPK